MSNRTRKTQGHTLAGQLLDANPKPFKVWTIPEPFTLNPAQSSTFHALTRARDKWSEYELRLLASAAQLIHDRQRMYKIGMDDPVVEIGNGVRSQSPYLKIANEMQSQICSVFMRLGLKETSLKALAATEDADEGKPIASRSRAKKDDTSDLLAH